MKLGIAVSLYFGNRNSSHKNYKINFLYYAKLNYEYITKLNTSIDKIYFICTFQSNLDASSILNELKNLYSFDQRVIIEYRDNYGLSYCSWKHAIDIDNGELDYIFLNEDDHVLYEKESLNVLLEYFYNNKDLLYLCEFWTKTPYQSPYGIIPEHASLSCGLLNNKFYQKLKKENSYDFKLIYETGYESGYNNQANFLEIYRQNNIKIMHWADKHSSIFAHDGIDYGNPNGCKILLPITENFF